MAGGAANMNQFELYFKRADLDQDGRISGPETVAFFQASGLPKPVLAQIWAHVDQNRSGYLGRAEFYNYLKLVTVAQSKRDLTPDIVKAALYGPASAKIPAPQINLGALPAPRSNLNVDPPTPAVPQSMDIRGLQGHSSQQSQVMRPSQSPLPNTTFQSQHGASHGMPSGGMMLTSGPPGSNIDSLGVSSQVPSKGINPSTSMDVFGLASSGSTLSAQPRPQGPSLSQNVASKPNGRNLSPSVAGAKDFSNHVAGNGFAANSAFGDAFSAAASQAKQNSVVPMPSEGGLPVSSSNIPASAGTQLPNKPNQSFNNRIAHQSTASQNQQMQSTFRHNQQVMVQNSSTLPVRAENFPSSQSSQPWPKMSQSNVQKYTKVFMEVDTDRDGKVTGEQARNLFLSWRLPREILKQVWDLSDQDNDSMLSLKEFCIALYLMERYREGRPLPKALPANVIFEGTPLSPSGQAPAAYGAPLWRPPPGVLQAHGMTGPRQVTPAAVRPPRPVPVPIPEADEVVQPRQPKPAVPVLEKHLLDQLSTEEQTSLNSKFQEAIEADKKVGELEKDISEAKQKIEFYRSKMQEIVLYKSRCDSRLNEITERVSADKKEVESLSKRYEDKYKEAGDLASKLTIEEATFRDIQEKKMELYRAIVKLEQDGKPDEIQPRADRIQADLEEQVKKLNERCKMYGLRGKATSLVELPFGWQPGIEGGVADWDENWDKFEDEGFTFVKELTLDVQNVIAPPKPKSLPVQYKSTFRDEGADAINKPEHKTSNDEPNGQKKDSPVSRHQAEKNTGEDMSPHAIKTHSEHSGHKAFDEAGWGTFDSHYDSDTTWDLNATKPPKDMDEESEHENSLFDSDGWGDLNPIRTKVPMKKTFAIDSVPGTPAYSYSESPPRPGDNRGLFADSVPTTPAYSYATNSNFQQPLFGSDSIPSALMFPSSNSPDRSFTRFDSVSSNTQDSFARFNSFRSTNQDDQGFFQPQAFTRYDSMRGSTTDSDIGHSLFQSSDFSHGFLSFDDADLFKTMETPRRDSVDGWKAF